MTQNFTDQIKVDITCSACSQSFKESVTRLQTNPELACPRCGHRIQVKFEGGASLEKVNQSYRNLQKTLDKIGKRR